MRTLFAFRNFLPILVFLILAKDTNSTASPKGVSLSHPARVITLRILMSNGARFVASQRERGAINIEAGKWSLNISPHCSDYGSVIAEVTGRSGKQVLAESLEINKRWATMAIKSGSSADIQVQAIQVLDITLGKDIMSSTYARAEERCCVTCSGITVCGCSVEGPCASCCAGSCCDLTAAF